MKIIRRAPGYALVTEDDLVIIEAWTERSLVKLAIRHYDYEPTESEKDLLRQWAGK